jgi:hypothetical protein
LIGAGCKSFNRELTLEELAQRHQQQREIEKMWFKPGTIFYSK